MVVRILTELGLSCHQDLFDVSNRSLPLREGMDPGIHSDDEPSDVEADYDF